jgi:hypothetical protein
MSELDQNLRGNNGKLEDVARSAGLYLEPNDDTTERRDRHD